ncbi:MAG: putative cytokinetic ring protein SteA [Bacillota bacterium]
MITEKGTISGKVKIDQKTKDLVKRIKPGEIAIINHKDIDQIAGQSLKEKKVKAVINLNKSISGKYPNKGPLILHEAGIPIIDNCDSGILSLLKENENISIIDGIILKNGDKIGSGNLLTKKEINNKLKKAEKNLTRELDKFIDNTLYYAHKEKSLILDVQIPDIDINFKRRQALIVVRGPNYKKDLLTVKSYIDEINPIIIAVDGGADACLEQGYNPDIIIGDMDSVSDKALLCGALVIVHAYPDGEAPGLDRIEKLGIKSISFPAPGTSEDIAMLLAFEKGAELITAVGTHSNMVDFLEKGRPGMASTLLVRMKIGNKLVDARGVNKLYKSDIHYHYWFQILLAILVPISILGIFSPPIKHFLQLLVMRLSLILSY